MNEIGTLLFTFEGWWRPSSGHTEGDLLDDVMTRSPDGLPWLPGRTVKGLLRDAVSRLEAFGHAVPGTTAQLFGLHVDDVDDPEAGVEARFLTEPGLLRFGSAEMDAAWRTWAARTTEPGSTDQTRVRDALFDRRQMTAVDLETGAAKTGQLRSVEVAVPMDLTAPVAIVFSADDHVRDTLADTLGRAAGLIRAVGAGRNRGFGRVAARFAPNSGGRVA